MDIIKSFTLEDGQFRGTMIAADETVRKIWAKQDYPQVLRPMFHRAVLLALALSAGLKYTGVFSLQVKGNGPVSSLFVDVTTDKKVRGYIVWDKNKPLPETDTVSALFGQGQMIFSVAGLGQEPYQGVVSLRHDSLTDVVADYFQMSEQIPTDMVLRISGENGRCLLVQQMPLKQGALPDDVADKGETIGVLMHSVRDDELFSETLSPDDVLYRLFHANQVRVFDPLTPCFECRCYRGKMESFLKKMAPNEREALYDEQGEIKVSCQFCGEVYTFTKKDFD